MYQPPLKSERPDEVSVRPPVTRAEWICSTAIDGREFREFIVADVFNSPDNPVELAIMTGFGSEAEAYHNQCMMTAAVRLFDALQQMVRLHGAQADEEKGTAAWTLLAQMAEQQARLALRAAAWGEDL